MITRLQRLSLTIAFLLSTLLLSRPAAAQRPTAPKLLPYNTVGYLRIASLPEFKAKLSDTSFGKISSNENVQSLMSTFYDEFLLAYPEIEEELGMPLDELLDLPQGEVCAAVTVTDTGSVMFFLLVDFADNLATIEKLIGRLDEAVLADGGGVDKEMVSETEVIVYDNPLDTNSPEVIIKDGTLVVTTNRLLTEHVVAHWEGTATPDQRTFSQNRKFTAIMRSSVGTEEARPHMSWYFDPLTLVTATTQGNFAAQAAMAILPTLGLDGFKALGGSVILAPAGFDSISHTHIALAVPRRGVLDLLTFGTGDGTPEPWVPDDVPAYITGYWNVDEAFDNLTTLLDTIIGEGEFTRRVDENVNLPLDIDLREDVIESLAGRFTLATWVVPPARINSQAMMLSIELKEGHGLEEDLDRLLGLVPPIEQRSYNNQDYWGINVPGPGDQPVVEAQPGQPGQPGRPGFPLGVRVPSPCIALLGNYLVLTDSEEFLKHAIDTNSSNSGKLADSEDYALIRQHIKNQLGEEQASMITFSQPQDQLQLILDVIGDDQTKSFLADNAERGRFLGVLNNVMNNATMPSMDELLPHIAPSGSVMIDNEAGLHFIGFTLKPAEE